VALVGCTIMTLATVPLASIDAGTSIAMLAAVLIVRGMGLSAAMPRAGGVLTGLQRIGGSIGTALPAVILEQRTRTALASAGAGSSGLQPVTPTARAHFADPLATAFGHSFGWAAAMTAAAIIPAAFLARIEWSSRTARAV
jgi:hypothetical protein